MPFGYSAVIPQQLALMSLVPAMLNWWRGHRF